MSQGVPSLPAEETRDSGTDPGPDWIPLPFSRSPRWLLPREPAMQARAGLSVYHPVTIRSRLGWEATRVLAGRGAFRFLRGSGLLPKEIWDAAGPLIPAGGAVAIARANHPGRFQAIIFDANGRSTTFVKVARDTMGSLALTKEREALDRFAAHVPLPLIAPELLSHADGVLVFRAMEWQARVLAWRLPEEVAFAIGGFFRRTSTDGGASGAAHGDFAPWNLLHTESGWGLVDWENVQTGAPPYYDLFHFLVQASAGMRRPSLRRIQDGLSGNGWIGAAIRAYGAGSGVDHREGAHFLREYLRTRVAGSDAEVPKRVRRVWKKMSDRLGP